MYPATKFAIRNTAIHPFSTVSLRKSMSTVAVEWRSLQLPRRLTEASRMKRLDYSQQKLPLSLHRMEILEGSGIIVCSVLYTLLRN